MAQRTKLEMTQRWAEIVIERWQARMEALEVGDTGTLLRSFRAQVDQDSSGDPTKVTFAFLLYGRFPDMGVGLDFENKIIMGNRVIDPETGAYMDIDEPGLARRILPGFGWLRKLWHFLRGRSHGRVG